MMFRSDRQRKAMFASMFASGRRSGSRRGGNPRQSPGQASRARRSTPPPKPESSPKPIPESTPTPTPGGSSSGYVNPFAPQQSLPQSIWQPTSPPRSSGSSSSQQDQYTAFIPPSQPQSAWHPTSPPASMPVSYVNPFAPQQGLPQSVYIPEISHVAPVVKPTVAKLTQEEQIAKIHEFIQAKNKGEALPDIGDLGFTGFTTTVTSAGLTPSGVDMAGRITGFGKAGEGSHYAPRSQFEGSDARRHQPTGQLGGYEGWFNAGEVSDYMTGLTKEAPGVNWVDVWGEKDRVLLVNATRSLMQSGGIPETVQFPHRLTEIARDLGPEYDEYESLWEETLKDVPDMRKELEAMNRRYFHSLYPKQTDATRKALEEGFLKGYITDTDRLDAAKATPWKTGGGPSEFPTDTLAQKKYGAFYQAPLEGKVPRPVFPKEEEQWTPRGGGGASGAAGAVKKADGGYSKWLLPGAALGGGLLIASGFKKSKHVKRKKEEEEDKK